MNTKADDKNKLTKSQQKVFDFICRFKDSEGYPPTYRDIAKEFNYGSDGTVKTYLIYLENKGYIQRLGKARGLKILKTPPKKVIPILGEIAAGNPIAAYEDNIGTLDDIEPLTYQPDRFALKIRGDSMIDAGIFDGDLAIIQRNTHIKNNDIVAVLLDDDATLKRLRQTNDQVTLLPENKNYEPIVVTQQQFQARIVGKYIGLVRSSIL
ncbi:transcriptional repressor LexA [Candidatus Marinamargulisbacteria bacterium SCGC AAA071-K20]|nr:transcriptional repressor LexA [Candidatus Marinamargulisbacteria bacterium SCGC AAA071-K20]